MVTTRLLQTAAFAVSSPLAPSATAANAREAASQFEGLLFAQALKPIAAGCGFLGDAVVASVATDLARRDGGPLEKTFERAIDGAGLSSGGPA